MLFFSSLVENTGSNDDRLNNELGIGNMRSSSSLESSFDPTKKKWWNKMIKQKYRKVYFSIT